MTELAASWAIHRQRTGIENSKSTIHPSFISSCKLFVDCKTGQPIKLLLAIAYMQSESLTNYVLLLASPRLASPGSCDAICFWMYYWCVYYGWWRLAVASQWLWWWPLTKRSLKSPSSYIHPSIHLKGSFQRSTPISLVSPIFNGFFFFFKT